jgi:hypothetical protein
MRMNIGDFFEDLPLRLKCAHCTRKYLGYTAEKMENIKMEVDRDVKR